MKTGKMVDLILVAVALGMGIAAVVVTLVGSVLTASNVLTMLGIGLSCLALVGLEKVA